MYHKIILPLLIVFLFADAMAFAVPVDHWAPCPASPAVVNSATPSPLQNSISLRGEWDFVTDPMLMGRHRMGKGPGWNEPKWDGMRTIQVPGCWEAQEVGEPGMSLPWDPPFDCIPRPLNHIYMGTARYRKVVAIPQEWQDKRIWLKVGGVRTEAWFWVNKQRIAHLNTYCGAYKYDITDYIIPGETAEIIATVRNDTPSRKGCKAAFHRFGGFYRDIELEATPDSWIDDAWVRGNFDKQSAIVNITVQHTGGPPPSSLSATIKISTRDGNIVGNGESTVTFNGTETTSVSNEIPLSVFRLWTPETPDLYLATITLLADGIPIHGWIERFGIRKLEVRGDRFYLNNTPFFVRGYGDDYIYPLTLISPPDKEAHLAHLLKAREAGFNYVRHHTHCEIPEFFEAADEAGILIQPELPYYHDITTEGFEFDPMRDIQELYRHYRRYVSFASYSTGNEGYLGSPLDIEIYQWAKATDPDRIFQHQDGGCNTTENADYFTPNGYGLASSIRPWAPGTFDAVPVPFIAHEYLNLGIKMDPRIAPKFTGAIPAPRSQEDYEAALQTAGLERSWGDACLNSAHRLQGYYQKRGIEQARHDPACDGYSYWTIVDVMVPQAGTFTGQGFLNAFWEQKEGGLSLEQFYQFNGPAALLATFTPESVIAVSDESCTATFYISHFTHERWTNKQIEWQVVNDDTILATGVSEAFDVESGDVKEVSNATFTVPPLEKPIQARFEARASGTDIHNEWDFWFFPKREKKQGTSVAVTEDIFDTLATRYNGLLKAGSDAAATADVVIGSWDHPDLLAAMKQGKRGIMIGPAEGKPNIELGWWSLGDQIGTAFANHPVFGNFPHDGALSPLWFRLIKRGLSLPIDPKYGTFTYYAVGEGKEQYFAYIMEKQGKEEQPLLMTYGMDMLADTPEGDYLLDTMIQYVLNSH